MDAVIQSAMVRTDIADDVQRLEPARQLRGAQPARVCDRILNISWSKSVQTRQATPAEQFDSSPQGQDPVVVRVMVRNEILARMLQLKLVFREPGAVCMTASRSPMSMPLADSKSICSS